MTSLAPGEKALGKRPVTSREPPNLQVRAALDAHYQDGRIGREMLAAENAVAQVRSRQGAGTPAAMPPPPPRIPQGSADREQQRRREIGHYYKKHFPYAAVHRWASRAWVPNGPSAHKREYGWEGIGGSPFVRWKSCPTPTALHEMVSGADCGKLNIGAMFSADPSNRYKEREPMQALRREFVIDIDLDDYGGISKDDLRTCDMNWPLVAVGLEVCKQVLQTGFGFKHILPVYSGRRGGHLWVCDERACRMDDAARTAVATMLSPPEGKGKKWWVELVKHPNFKEISENLIVPFFRSVCIWPSDQGGLGMFELPFQRRAFLDSIHESVSKALGTQVVEADMPGQALDIVQGHCKRVDWKWEKYQAAIWDLIGPRIDANVSKHANHTLKSPYSVHPKTGRISVPILHDQLHEFPVAARAPRTQDLLDDRPNPSVDTLQRSVEAFGRFVDKLAASPTEQWVPDETQPVAKKLKAVHDMTGPVDDTSNEPVLADYPRPALKMQRVWTVQPSTETPGMVSLLTCVSADPSSNIVIKAGQYPPFEHEYGNNLERIVSDIAQAAVYTRDDSRALHGASKRFIFVANQGEPDYGPKTHEYCTKLCERLAENVEVAELNLQWGDDSLKSYIRQKVSPFVTDLYSPRRPRPPDQAPAGDASGNSSSSES